MKPSIFPVLSFISTIPPSSYIKYIIAFQLNLQIMALTLAPFKLCRPQLTTSSQQHFGLGIIHQHITSFQFLPVNEHSKNRCSLQEKKAHRSSLYPHCSNLSQVDNLYLKTSHPVKPCLGTTKGNQTSVHHGTSRLFNLIAFQVAAP